MERDIFLGEEIHTIISWVIFRDIRTMTAVSYTHLEIVYSPMVAEPQEYQYNADAFEARSVDEVKQEAAHKETAKVREDKSR